MFKIEKSSLPEVLILEPYSYYDDRGFFFESFNQRKFNGIINRNINFVQDNHSYSVKNVLRGLHYQLYKPQGKLIRVIKGSIYDVAVDLRSHSKSFGNWTAFKLTEQNKKQLWIPEGFAHGFLVLSEFAEVLYKTTEYWYKDDEKTIKWNDPALNISWPIKNNPIVSKKDSEGFYLNKAQTY